MCEHPCSLEGVMKELVDLEVAEVLMKRIRSRMHNVPPSNESRELELNCVS